MLHIYCNGFHNIIWSHTINNLPKVSLYRHFLFKVDTLEMKYLRSKTEVILFNHPSMLFSSRCDAAMYNYPGQKLQHKPVFSCCPQLNTVPSSLLSSTTVQHHILK